MINKEKILSKYSNIIENSMKNFFDSQKRYPEKLYDLMKYHLGWLDENLFPIEKYGGKKLRPTLCLLSYLASSDRDNREASNDIGSILPAAIAIELIHNFSLIHDDIEDNSAFRRGRPTIWKLWGVPHAINVGDCMFSLVNLSAIQIAEYFSEEETLNVLKILNSAVMELSKGQYLDMDFENRFDITTNDYLDMVSKKTAALISASTHIGALLATNDPQIIARFKNFGKKIGIAFQIRDDIIGIWSKKTGKTKAEDIINKKKTLPIIYGLNIPHASKELKEIYQKNKRKIKKSDVEIVLKILEDVNSLNYSQKIAEVYEKEAIEELNKTGIKNNAMYELKTITEFLVKREY